MSKRQYTTEFKREVLAMAAKGEKSVPELERDLGITPGLVYKWRRRYRINEEQGELARMVKKPDLRGDLDLRSLPVVVMNDAPKHVATSHRASTDGSCI